jgi:NADH-quinone oxidoreductase subunit H
VLYLAAPVVMMLPALSIFAVIPFGNQITVFGHTTKLVIAELPVGVLYVLAISSLGVYGLVLSGWASNSKYSLLGGLRSSAQMVSYELPMGLAVVCAVMMSTSRAPGSLNLNKIVDSQAGGFVSWNFLWPLGDALTGVPFAFLFTFVGLLSFALYFVCAIAETNRAPFDLPEAETELVAGYHTEYSSMKFAMFFLGEYANMINVSAIATTLFLGGWHSPIPIDLPVPEGSFLEVLGPVFWFVSKITVFMFVYIWLRATLPRLRYDQLMRFTWKGLVPLALANIMLIATLLTLFYPPLPPAT